MQIHSAVHSLGRFEFYTEWFRCPMCRCDNIAGSYKFCPECGELIEWPKSLSDEEIKTLKREKNIKKP